MHLISLLLRQSPAFYAVAALGALLSAVVYVVLRAALSPLRTVPGPRWARFTNLWLLRQLWRREMHQTQIDLHKKYGPVVRIAPNEYSLNDLEAYRTIYAHGAKYLKSEWYLAFGNPNTGHAGIFQERDDKIHGEQRRLVANLYSMSAMLSYEGFVRDNTNKLVSKLSEMAKQHEAFSVTDWMQYYAFDVIGAITVGKSFDFLDHGYDWQGILKEIHASQVYASRMGTWWPRLHKYIMFQGPYFGIRIPRLATQAYVNNNVDRKRRAVELGETTEDTTGKQDFVEKLLKMEEKGKADNEDIKRTVSSNINAGSDTTAVSLSAILYHLIQNPVMLAKVRAEIKEAIDAGKASIPISYKDAQELPYLQAVIKEALRLHPATGLSLPRTVPEGGATFAGHHFPAGAVVGINNWVLHRNKDAFGPDADEFRPERWLESKERSSAMERYFMTFGAGARVCIGKNISMLEMNTAIPELVMKFDFELDDPKGEWEIDNIFFVVPKYKCYIREREVTF